MRCIYVKLGDALVQLSLSNSVYERNSKAVFEEVSDTLETMIKAATVVSTFSLAEMKRDKNMLDRIPDIQIIAAIIVLLRGKEHQSPDRELIIKAALIKDGNFVKAVSFEAFHDVGMPNLIVEWKVGDGPNAIRHANTPHANSDKMRPN